MNGMLTLEEFRESYTTPGIRDKFKKLDLPGSEAEEIFSLLDPMGRGGIQLEDFISSCALLIGGAEMAKNVTQIALQVETLSRRLDGLDNKIELVETSVKSIRDRTKEFLLVTLPLITGDKV